MDERIRRAVDQFLLSENTTTEAKEVLLRYAETRPNRANPDPIIPTEEIGIRLELIAKLERLNDTSDTTLQRDSDGHFQFTFLQLSYLMLIPINCLRDLSEQSDTFLHPYLNLEAYVPFMVRGKMPGEGSSVKRSASRASLDTSQHGGSHVNVGNKSVRRNPKERDKTLDRDGGVCMLTGAACPEVCHIIPFAINASEAAISQCRLYLPIVNTFLGKAAAKRLQGLLGHGPGSSDKSWNMLCLHPTLHNWWGKCLFGLKFHGILPSSNVEMCAIQLQLHWMPRNGSVARECTKADADAVQKMLQTIKREQDYGLFTDSRKYDSRPLETGDVFSLVMPSEEADKMKTMIDIQWANTKLAAISGAAGIWELPGESPDEPDIDRAELIAAWRETLQPSETSP
ncbi:hypothetical protein V8C42DRAFT_309537 [Trichoderma barbatum]